MRPHFLTDMTKFKQIAYQPDSDGTMDPALLQFGQFNITVTAVNAFTDPGRAVINISLMYEPVTDSTQVTYSMALFAIIVLLLVSLLSTVYLSYRQQEMRLTSKQLKDMTEQYQRTSFMSSRRGTNRYLRSTSSIVKKTSMFNTSGNIE